MARYSVDFSFPLNWLSQYGTQQDVENEAVKIRNLFRTALDGTTFTVSDIAKWLGDVGMYGYAFVIKNGVREWCFTFGSKVGTPDEDADWWISPTGSSYNPYLAKLASVDYSLFELQYLYEVRGPLFLYNGGQGSYGFGFDDPVNLTFTGGDFSTPVNNPHTNLTQFLNVFPMADTSSALKGLELRSGNSHWGQSLFILDDSDPSITVYHKSNDSNDRNFVSVMGDILSNYESADADTDATVTFSLTVSSGNPPSVGNYVMSARDMNGNTLDFGYERHTSFTVDNRLDVNGDYKYNSFQLIHDTYTKGIVRNDIIINAGAWDSWIDMGVIITGPSGPYFKYERGLAFPYKSGLERWPYPTKNYPGS